MKAIETALQTTINNLDTEIEFQRNMWVITDSLSAITALSGGPGSQYNAIGSKIWELLNEISRCNIKISFQWIPGHRGIPGNEEADMAAGEASLMAQEQCPIDFQTTKCAVKRKISSEWLESAIKLLMELHWNYRTSSHDRRRQQSTNYVQENLPWQPTA